MKKLLLLASAAFVSVSSFAQDNQGQIVTDQYVPTIEMGTSQTVQLNKGKNFKVTGETPDFRYSPYAGMQSGPFTNYVADKGSTMPYDSGRLNGISVYGYTGFAQYYGLVVNVTAPVDSSLWIMGVVSRFAGVATSTSKLASFNVWDRDFSSKVAVAGRAKYFIGGQPKTPALNSKTVAFNALNLTGKGGDTGLTIAMFTNPTKNVNKDVYVGYTVPSYTFSAASPDIFGLYTVPIANGAYSGLLDSVTAVAKDTIITAYSLVQNGSAWKSNFEMGTGVPTTNGNLVIYPILRISCATCGGSGVGVNTVRHNGLSIYGNYPNPAVNSTSIKYALAATADVTISVLDIAGRTISKVTESKLSVGDHTTVLNTQALASGTYIYLIETSVGDGIAAQFTVAK